MDSETRAADRFAPLIDPTALPRVLSRAKATQLGYSRHAIDRRVATGRWRRVLPRTYLTVDTLTWSDRLVAALAFAGPDALLSGAAVLNFAELRGIARPDVVLVLVGQRNRVRSAGWVRIRRTDRLPEPQRWYGPRRVPIARAVADHALQLRRIDDVRAVVAEAIRTRACSVAELVDELRAGPRQGSAFLRRAIAEVGGGAWSAPEARAARLLRRAGLPAFEQNVRIEVPGGGYLVGDLVWRELGGVLEIDSQENHLDPASWRATMDRHLALTTLGWSVIHRPPSVVTDQPSRFVREVRDWLAGLTHRRAG
jgi:hypothetical protein